jgi:DNA-binding CsgD family transcriptional regulator
MMRAHKTAAYENGSALSVRERILGGMSGSQDPALVFAASSIINEVCTSYSPGTSVVREVRTEAGSYRLIGSRVAGLEASQPVVFVYAEPLNARAPQMTVEEIVMSGHRLTRKEARVASLLAADKSNEEIAAELCISTHTARHHTQSVLSKLGISSRREVARVLRQR